MEQNASKTEDPTAMRLSTWNRLWHEVFGSYADSAKEDLRDRMACSLRPTASGICDAAFAEPRDPRSPEYRAGVLEALKFRLGEIRSMSCPHRAGTARADAWLAGADEGHRLAREQVRSTSNIS